MGLGVIQTGSYYAFQSTVVSVYPKAYSYQSLGFLGRQGNLHGDHESAENNLKQKHGNFEFSWYLPYFSPHFLIFQTAKIQNDLSFP